MMDLLHCVILAKWESFLSVILYHCVFLSHISHDDRVRQRYSRKYYVKWWFDFVPSDEDYQDWSYHLDRVAEVASWTLVYRFCPFWSLMLDHWWLIYTPQKGSSQGATLYHREGRESHQNSAYSSWGYLSMLVRGYSYAMENERESTEFPKKANIYNKNYSHYLAYSTWFSLRKHIIHSHKLHYVK